MPAKKNTGKGNTSASRSTAKTSAAKTGKTTASEGRNTAKSREEYRKRMEEKMRAQRQRRALLLFVIAIFLGFLILIEGESLWKWMHHFILGVFGAGAIAWPLLLLYIAVVTALEKFRSQMKVKVGLVAAFVFMLCTAFYVFRAPTLPQNSSYFEMLGYLYTRGAERESIGLASGILGYPFVKLLGVVGSKIVVILILFITVMFLTGTTLGQLFRAASKPVKAVADNIEQKREVRRQQADLLASDIDIPLDDGHGRGKKLDDVLANTGSSEKRDQLLRVHGIDPDGGFGEETFVQEEFRKEKERAAQPPVIISDTSVVDVMEDMRRRENENRRLRQRQENARAAEEKLPEPLPPVKKQEELRPYQVLEKAGAEKPAAEKQPAEKETVQAEPVEIEIKQEPPKREYRLPPTSLLEYSHSQNASMEENERRQNAQLLIDTLRSFGISAKVVGISHGPTVTQYEIQPAAGVKISKITNLADDLAMNLAASGVRIEAPIPGKAAVGIEVPNKHKATVRMRDIVESDDFQKAKSKLTVTLGRDISGQITLTDLSKMPHLLIAGTTGSGKSVCVNSFILSILYKATPEEVRFLMIDPKMVELPVYNGIPHLLIPVVTDPRKAAGALNWAVGEMMKRYKMFAEAGVKDIEGYNKRVESGNFDDSDTVTREKMPKILIVIDELADIMMVAPKETEDSICRLAQLARAAGIHLVVATQRPSVDVITGLIKANIPSRIALTVASVFDSKTILDTGGAEKLLGYGDMLFMPVGAVKPHRVQGCYVSEEERESIIEFIKKSGAVSEYDASIVEQIEKGAAQESDEGEEESESFEDPMTDEAIKCVIEAGQASTSLLQRRLRLGYARAGRLIDQLEQMGVVGPHEGSKPRAVLMTYQQYLERNMNRADANEAAQGNEGDAQ